MTRNSPAILAEIVVHPIPADKRAAVVRAICGHAHDAADAQRLLAMLGLDPQEAT